MNGTWAVRLGTLAAVVTLAMATTAGAAEAARATSPASPVTAASPVPTAGAASAVGPASTAVGPPREVRGAPVDPTPRTLVQPDGTSFQAVQHGDAVRHWWTAKGATIARTGDGTWRFATGAGHERPAGPGGCSSQRRRRVAGRGRRPVAGRGCCDAAGRPGHAGARLRRRAEDARHPGPVHQPDLGGDDPGRMERALLRRHGQRARLLPGCELEPARPDSGHGVLRHPERRGDRVGHPADRTPELLQPAAERVAGRRSPGHPGG